MTSQRTSLRDQRPSLIELQELEEETRQALQKSLQKNPNDFKDEDEIKNLAKEIKIARDDFSTRSRNLTSKLFAIGSMQEAHEFRGYRTQLLGDAFEAVRGINALLEDLHLDSVSNFDDRSVVSAEAGHENGAGGSSSPVKSNVVERRKTENGGTGMAKGLQQDFPSVPASQDEGRDEDNIIFRTKHLALNNKSIKSCNASSYDAHELYKPKHIYSGSNAPLFGVHGRDNTAVAFSLSKPHMSLGLRNVIDYESIRCVSNSNDELYNSNYLYSSNNLTNQSTFAPGLPTKTTVGSNHAHGSFLPMQQNTDINTKSIDPLAQYLLKQDLIKNSIEPFDGSAYKYNAWKTQITARISGLNLTPYETINVLLSHCKGEPKEMIQKVLSMNVVIDNHTLEEVWNMLRERHGNPYRASFQLRDKLMKFPIIKGSRSEVGLALQNLYDLCRVVSSYMRHTPHLEDLNNPSGQAVIRNKLPDNVLERWQTVGHAYECKHFINPPFSILVEFLHEISREFSNRNFDKFISYNEPKRYRVLYSKECFEKNDAKNKEKVDMCSIHQNSKHSLSDCRTFSRLPFYEKTKKAKKEGRCFRCLGKHLQSNCTENVECTICHKDHCTAMHRNTSYKDNSRSETSNEICDRSGEHALTENKALCTALDTFGNDCTAIKTHANGYKSCSKTLQAEIFMEGVPDKRVKCMVIIDEQSTSSFVDPKVVSFFGKEFPKVSYTLSTMSNYKTTIQGERVTGLKIRGFGQSNIIELPSILTSSFIPNTKDEIASPAVVNAHPHISSFAKKFIEPDMNLDVLMLIGRDCGALMATKCYGDRPPFVHKTPLGYALVGEISSSKNRDHVKTFKTCLTHENDHFQANTCFLDSIRQQDFLTSAFQEKADDEIEGYSQNDVQFIEIMKNNVEVTNDGNLKLPLPLKNKDLLPNNKASVFNRTKTTLNNMKRIPEKRQSCLDIMEKNIKNKHVEQIPENQRMTEEGKAWWLPIFPVKNKIKNKYRLVFDASAQFRKVSLNNQLLSGPDLNNQLRAVLLRFRERNIAFVADVEGMFNAFKVPCEQTDYLRFFWYSNNDPQNQLVEYRALYHIFGACSSPAVAAFALKYTTTTVHARKYQKAINFIRNNFYVDDGLYSADTDDKAITILSEAKELLQIFGIRLHKIVSNSRKVLESFPVSERGDCELSMHFQEASSTRTLGVKWNPTDDNFIVDVKVPHNEFTKRGILSTVNSLYDPIGLISPVSLGGRVIQRKIISPTTEDDVELLKNLGWDSALPRKYYSEWIQWEQSLKYLKDIQLPRCFLKPNSIKISQELHIFADASDLAVGYVAYLRSIDENGAIHVSFVLANSRLAPRNATSTPRLELCAALCAAKAAQWITSELESQIDEIHYYSDSVVTLGYINNKVRRFSKYVSRRINVITKISTADQWHYIPSTNNPADIATRPHSPQDLSSTIWFTGPAELKEKYIHPSPLNSTVKLPEEAEQATTLMTAVEKAGHENNIMNNIIKQSRTWCGLLKTVVLLWKMFYLLDKSRQRLGSSLAPSNPSISDDLCIKICIRFVQKEEFYNEIHTLSSKRELPEYNRISELTPFIDGEGILRVGGRISNARLPFSSKHPILLPAAHKITMLILMHHHEKVGHQGRHLTHGAIREAGFHILQGRQLIRSFIKTCILCQKLRGPRMTQRMANLPVDRIEQVPPFTNTGIDVFGNFYVHEGITTRRYTPKKKVWVVIFCCLVSRAIHCEMITGLDTSTFVNALRRFISIRGNVKIIRSDNGTNFVSARKQFENINLASVKNSLKLNNCEWLLNPVGASHFAGCYERKIGSVRRVLEKSIFLAGPKGLSKDEFLTLLYEASSIVNQTPLHEVSDHPDDPTPITPHMLLTLKEDMAPSNLEQFNQQDLLSYGKSRWRRVQHLSDQFWLRWRQDYLLELKRRHKWKKEKPCATEGDIVLISEKNTARNHWPLGRITSVKKSQDGLVRSVELQVMRSFGQKPKIVTRAIHDLIMLLPSASHGCVSQQST